MRKDSTIHMLRMKLFIGSSDVLAIALPSEWLVSYMVDSNETSVYRVLAIVEYNAASKNGV